MRITQGSGWVPYNKRSHIMQHYQDELTEGSKAFQKKIAETEKKIGDTTLQAQSEFIKTFEEMSRAVMSRATAEIEFGARLTQRLSEAHSLPDVVSAYQEWLGKEMSARSEDARRFMTSSQKFIAPSPRPFSNRSSTLASTPPFLPHCS